MPRYKPVKLAKMPSVKNHLAAALRASEAKNNYKASGEHCDMSQKGKLAKINRYDAFRMS